ncbi:Uncharacterised protein [Vibrio cholerae]|nr:Uncharacterised protein [Vibrio cholerae]
MLQQLAVFRIHHVELFLIDQHGLFGLPLCPSFFADVVENAFAQFAGIELEIQAIGFFLQSGTKYGASHSLFLFKCGYQCRKVSCATVVSLVLRDQSHRVGLSYTKDLCSLP